MSALGVAVVGCGDWGLNLVRNFGQAPGCELRWVVDIDSQRSARAGQSCTVGDTESLDDVLDDYVSVESARAEYGVVITGNGFDLHVDEPE